MRLREFILNNIESILVEWEAFARSVWPGVDVSPEELRDHAAAILREVAVSMEESRDEQSSRTANENFSAPSHVHGAGRVQSGFSLLTLMAEYRALRGSVIRLWGVSMPDPDIHDFNDRRRFNDSLDASLMEAVRGFTEKVEHSRQLFLGILGHDLRNPLNAMMLSAQFLARTPQLSTGSARIIAQISASGAVMARMIADLLDYTRASLDNEMPISPLAMDLESLCREVIDEARAANPGREFRYDPRGDLTGEWDPERIRQVVSNLLANAVQHGTGSIDLSVHGEGSEVRLVVYNQGKPIPKELLPTIFNPLVPTSPAESEPPRRPGSLGLGLYIAREIVNAHGGSMDVQSSEEAGTSFTVLLPRHRAGDFKKCSIASQ